MVLKTSLAVESNSSVFFFIGDGLDRLRGDALLASLLGHRELVQLVVVEGEEAGGGRVDAVAAVAVVAVADGPLVALGRRWKLRLLLLLLLTRPQPSACATPWHGRAAGIAT